ncbi:MAG: GTPase Era [Flavobacteriales bacterium]
MAHKAGFVNIVGSPNVGKSTLMNGLVGARMSIITSKHQTTRHRIRGLVNGSDFQIVYSDTPGVLEPKYKLHEKMMNFVSESLRDADIILLVTDIFEDSMNHAETLRKITDMDVPKFVLINKIDLAKDMEIVEKKVALWAELLPGAQILPISALEKVNTDFVIQKIKELLPESPAYFPKDELTDKPMRFFISEIIREKIFTTYNKEVPYSCEVVVEEYKEDMPTEGKSKKTITKIRALIIVNRETQKGIIIGHQGSKLTKVGTEARKDIEEFIGKKVFLDLYVKVDKDWKEKDNKLNQFGYDG